MHKLTSLPFRRTYSHLLLPSHHTSRSFSFHTLTTSHPSHTHSSFSLNTLTIPPPITHAHTHISSLQKNILTHPYPFSTHSQILFLSHTYSFSSLCKLTATSPCTYSHPLLRSRTHSSFTLHTTDSFSFFTLAASSHFTDSQHLSLHTGTQIYTLHTSSPHITCQCSQLLSSYTRPLSFTHSQLLPSKVGAPLLFTYSLPLLPPPPFHLTYTAQ